LGHAESIVELPIADDEQLYVELWVSLASLLRSYTAAHGLNGSRQATVELGEQKILVRHGDEWLSLDRVGAHVRWQRSDGRIGQLEFTEAGQLRGDTGEEALVGKEGLEEMDMLAERWARDLMREKQP
jgi:hypothetical protein